ncbi:MAG: MarR family winged helix-turn-helix transcriptional regulator [Christensenellales bacterium]
MDDRFSVLNRFLVEIFNEILKIEEQSITDSRFIDLSVREMHVIEAVCLAEAKGNSSKAADIAEDLNVTAGTLTTAVSLLEKKGYLVRQKDKQDRRVVRIHSTEKGKAVDIVHKEFHKQMVNNILCALNEEEQLVFIRALSSISVFFRKNKKNKGEVS